MNIDLTDEEFHYLVNLIKSCKYKANIDLHWFNTDNLFMNFHDNKKFLNQKTKELNETIVKCDELLKKLGVEE
jgi:hypothetical protein